MWRPTQLQRGGLRRLPRGDGGLAAAGGDDPHDLPDQPRDERQGDAQEVADLARPTRCGSARGSGRSGVVVHPGALKDDTRDNAKKRAIDADQGGARRDRVLPDHLREHRRLPAAPRPRLRRDRRADREDGRPKRLGLCIDTCHLHATGYDVAHPRGRRRDRRRDRRQGRPGAAEGAPRERLARRRAAPTATATPRSARARSGGRGFRAFLSEPRLPGLPAVSRARGSTARRPDRKDVQLVRQLRREGTRARSMTDRGGDERHRRHHRHGPSTGVHLGACGRGARCAPERMQQAENARGRELR